MKANPDLWIEVIVEGESLGRTKLGAVPYAVEAARVTGGGNADGSVEYCGFTSETNGRFEAPGGLLPGQDPLEVEARPHGALRLAEGSDNAFVDGLQQRPPGAANSLVEQAEVLVYHPERAGVAQGLVQTVRRIQLGDQ